MFTLEDNKMVRCLNLDVGRYINTTATKTDSFRSIGLGNSDARISRTIGVMISQMVTTQLSACSWQDMTSQIQERTIVAFLGIPVYENDTKIILCLYAKTELGSRFFSCTHVQWDFRTLTEMCCPCHVPKSHQCRLATVRAKHTPTKSENPMGGGVSSKENHLLLRLSLSSSS